MRITSSRVVLAAIVIASLWSSPLHGQVAAPKPEYFGFYVLDGSKLVAVGDGKSDTAPTLQPLNVAILGSSQPAQRSAVEVGAAVHFLLFDIAPAEAARALSIYRLPFVRNEITVSDVAFLPGSPAPTARQRNLPGMMRLAASQIRLLQKPVPAQPQMIELVPDPGLSEGLYGVLYAPAASLAVGGAGAGQNAGWTAILTVGQTSAASRSGQCIDLVLTGGLGGMLGIDSPDTGRIASFPLLDPGRAPACSSGAIRSEAYSAAPSAASARRSSLSLVDLQNMVEAGGKASVPVKFNSAIPGYMYMADGLVTVTRTTVAFEGTYTNVPFAVSPDKILDMAVEPGQSSRLHLTVAVKNKKGDKEDKKDYYFYSAGASAVGGGQGGQGARLDCSSCDDSMEVLRALLNKIRGGN